MRSRVQFSQVAPSDSGSAKQKNLIRGIKFRSAMPKRRRRAPLHYQRKMPDPDQDRAFMI
ncbi:MAG: hypothetical protein B7X53_09020 [Hyphomonas sp. 34-62-18]|nr:MAG: hypothetical protein B7X53_09020 [Hyphomonas sp. 34-62-18]